MMLHLYYAAGQGQSKAFLRTADSDVVVLAINTFHQLKLSELWIGYGTGKTYKDIPIHHISQMLGPQHCEVLPFFHAFTGCDVVSSMLGIGKKTAWNAWNAYLEVTNTLVAIIQDPSSLDRRTELIYSKNCDAELLNDARKFMFTHSLKSLDSIHPTQHALFQHAKRALLAAAFIWKQSLSKTPKIPKPCDWGWEWNTRTNQCHACSSIVVVSWPAGATKCHRAGLRCSTLCKCEGAAQTMTI